MKCRIRNRGQALVCPILLLIGLTAQCTCAQEPTPAVQETDAGFRVVVAHSLQKIRRDGPPLEETPTDCVRIEAARDETESFQLVVIPVGETIERMTVEAPPLEMKTGTPPSRSGSRSLGTVPVFWHPVAYVETGTPRGYTPDYVGWWPDVLLPPGPFDAAAGERQPLWFKVCVPPDAAPGEYEGQVTVRHGDQSVPVPVEVRVRNFRLPRPGALATAFGLYGHVLSGWYHGKKPYQDVMPVETFTRWCEFMGQYRLTPKNIANEYIQKVEDEKGTRLDLGLLKQTVGALRPKYYAPYSFCVYRLPCPREVREGTTKTDPAIWVAALKERADEYRRLGLPSEAYIYGIDEPAVKAYPFVQNVYRMVREAVPDFPIMQTVNQSVPEALVGLVDIWCPLSARADDDFYRARKQAGDTLWIYICCGPKPPHANFFVDEPAIDHRVVFWQARQAGATGFLYWCVCWWEGLPGPTSDKPHFPDVPVVLKGQAGTLLRLGVNGDGILIWPGPDMTPYPSLRLEVVRDGIEDYEYLALLERCVEKAKALPEDRRPSQEVIDKAVELCHVPEEISRSLTDYTKDPAPLVARRKAVGDMIEGLTEILNDAGRKEKT